MNRLEIQRLIRRMRRPIRAEGDIALVHHALEELSEAWGKWLQQQPDLMEMSFEEAWQRFSGEKVER